VNAWWWMQPHQTGLSPCILGKVAIALAAAVVAGAAIFPTV
jgi:hypothetical protein